ncbi:Orexin receptor type 2 [Stylophora pistillata]|uniref:Orexin receptor type 2 n=1 Tax=Stylophora pistillata TaxID=50429 RepID=A0A2B4SGT6_STYPI|nr:Orexin receptor type 2 [Stylophora pistillata]
MMTSVKPSPFTTSETWKNSAASVSLTVKEMIPSSGPPSTSLEVPEPFPSLVIRLALSILILVLNMAGNILVCVAVRKTRKLRSFRNYYYGLFLMSLAIADMAVGLVCMPFILLYYETGKYPFGFFGSTAVCKLIPALSLLCQGASIFSLTTLTLQRFMGIVYPMKTRLTLGRVKLLLALIWLCAFMSALPQIIVMDVNHTVQGEDNKFSCEEFWGNPPTDIILKEGYTLYLFVAEYLLPLIIMGIAYSKMATVLNRRDEGLEGRKSTNSRTKANHKKFIRLLIVLIVSFALCYLPNHVLFFWLDYGSGANNPYFSILMKYSHFCIWLNSCLNPYLYGALDDYFRQSYKKALRQCARIEEDWLNCSRRGDVSHSDSASMFASFKDVFEFTLTEILSCGIPVISAFTLSQTL